MLIPRAYPTAFNTITGTTRSRKTDITDAHNFNSPNCFGVYPKPPLFVGVRLHKEITLKEGSVVIPVMKQLHISTITLRFDKMARVFVQFHLSSELFNLSLVSLGKSACLVS